MYRANRAVEEKKTRERITPARFYRMAHGTCPQLNARLVSILRQDKSALILQEPFMFLWTPESIKTTGPMNKLQWIHMQAQTYEWWKTHTEVLRQQDLWTAFLTRFWYDVSKDFGFIEKHAASFSADAWTFVAERIDELHVPNERIMKLLTNHSGQLSHCQSLLLALAPIDYVRQLLPLLHSMPGAWDIVLARRSTQPLGFQDLVPWVEQLTDDQLKLCLNNSMPTEQEAHCLMLQYYFAELQDLLPTCLDRDVTSIILAFAEPQAIEDTP